MNIHWKDWCWSSTTLATWCEEPAHWNPDAGKDWRQEEKGMAEDEMVGWHHWLKGREFEQTVGDGEGQRSLVCCSPWDGKELDVTEQLNSSKEKRWLMRPSCIAQAVLCSIQCCILYSVDQLCSVLYGWPKWKEIQDRGDICKHIAGSFCWTEEIYTTL